MLRSLLLLYMPKKASDRRRVHPRRATCTGKLVVKDSPSTPIQVSTVEY